MGRLSLLTAEGTGRYAGSLQILTVEATPSAGAPYAVIQAQNWKLVNRWLKDGTQMTVKK